MKRIGLIIGALLACIAVKAQQTTPIPDPFNGGITVSLRPTISGSHTTTNCTPGVTATLYDSGSYYLCTGTNTWTLIASGSSASFSSLTGGTNTTAAMLVGTGASLGVTGTGTISANQVNGAVFPTSAAVVASNASAQAIAATVTGTGTTVVLQTSPALTTPKVTTITDANGNPFLLSSATASAVDSLTVTNAAAANPATVAITASGTDSNINLNIVSKGSGAVQVNGNPVGTVITSGSPASPQITKFTSATAVTGATAHDIDNVPLACLDSSGSGTAQVCSTSPTFTPGAGDTITYKTTTTNTGALTLAVNGGAAAPVQKWLGSALVSGDLPASKYVKLTFDGTNWQLMTIGNAPAGFTISSSDTSITATNCVSGPTCNLVVGATVSAPAAGASIACAFGAPSYTCRHTGTIGSNATISASGTVTGKMYLIVLVHDNTATSYTITWPANFINFPNIWNEANAELDIAFTCDPTPNCHPFSSYLGVGNETFAYGPERAEITTTAAGFGAMSFSTSAHTLVYYGNNVANRHAMPRLQTGDQLAASDCTNCAAVIATSATTPSPLNTALIASGACATTVTATATGATANSKIVYTPTANPQGITGYAASASGSLYIWAYPTANAVNFEVCNNTAAGITPGAMSLNWIVY